MIIGSFNFVLFLVLLITKSFDLEEKINGLYYMVRSSNKIQEMAHRKEIDFFILFCINILHFSTNTDEIRDFVVQKPRFETDDTASETIGCFQFCKYKE